MVIGITGNYLKTIKFTSGNIVKEIGSSVERALAHQARGCGFESRPISLYKNELIGLY